MRLGLPNQIIVVESTSDFKISNSIANFGQIGISMTILSRQSRFWSNFDLFRLKDGFRDRKSRLNDQKVNLFGKSQSNSIYFDSFCIYIKFFDLILVWFRIESSRRVNRTAQIGSEKSIIIRFKFDFKQNLAQGRSNRISLDHTQPSLRNSSIYYDSQMNCFKRVQWLDVVLMPNGQKHKGCEWI